MNAWMKVAATIILAVGLGSIGYRMFNKSPRELVVQSGQTVTKDTLPDRSVVTINKGSSISYIPGLKGKSRNVKLQGEAFFNIAPDKSKPFIIAVNGIRVTVVGTSFNVKSNNESTEIIVESGIVRVDKDKNTIELRANEEIKVAPADTMLVKRAVTDHLYNYYRTRQFVCDDTPLWKLVQVLNEAYDAHIVFADPGLKELKLNTTFNNESLDQVLNVVSLTFNIKITRDANTIVLQ